MKTSKSMWRPHPSKNLKLFWKSYPQPQKTSKFEVEAEDPQVLRSQFTTLACSICLKVKGTGCVTFELPEKWGGGAPMLLPLKCWKIKYGIFRICTGVKFWLSNASSFCSDKIYFVQDKTEFVMDKTKLSWKKKYCSGQNVLSWTKCFVIDRNAKKKLSMAFKNSFVIPKLKPR